jgi:predicted short-subunit dehydrogenase-like oxidoreductase (DUF2520 family)
MGQVERVAATAGLPLNAFAGLIRAASEDAFALGPGAALTGPAARGDWETVERHRATISSMPAHRTELAGYDAMVGLARRLSLDTALDLDLSSVEFTGQLSFGAVGPTPAEQVA